MPSAICLRASAIICLVDLEEKSDNQCNQTAIRLLRTNVVVNGSPDGL